MEPPDEKMLKTSDELAWESAAREAIEISKNTLAKVGDRRARFEEHRRERSVADLLEELADRPIPGEELSDPSALEVLKQTLSDHTEMLTVLCETVAAVAKNVAYTRERQDEMIKLITDRGSFEPFEPSGAAEALRAAARAIVGDSRAVAAIERSAKAIGETTQAARALVADIEGGRSRGGIGEAAEESMERTAAAAERLVAAVEADHVVYETINVSAVEAAFIRAWPFPVGELVTTAELIEAYKNPLKTLWRKAVDKRVESSYWGSNPHRIFSQRLAGAMRSLSINHVVVDGFVIKSDLGASGGSGVARWMKRKA
jgi:hypothetical protein